MYVPVFLEYHLETHQLEVVLAILTPELNLVHSTSKHIGSVSLCCVKTTPKGNGLKQLFISSQFCESAV